MAQTILAVEDDGIYADYLETVLTDLGYAVLGPVATGEDAIARAKANKPDLILMDIKLRSFIDGVDAASRLTLPLALRQAAAGALCRNTEKHGILLTTEQIQEQYRRYNQSEKQDAGTQHLLGRILDYLEVPVRTEH